MGVFKVVPEIHMLESVAELKKELDIGEGDLVIAGSVWKRLFADTEAGEVLIVSDFASGEPTDELVEKMYSEVKKPYRRVIGIGGGTVLDCSKLFALKDVSPVSDVFDGKIPAVKEKELVLIPTTCGTGSEVTNISILEFKSRNTKFGLANDAIFADEAYIVPELLNSMPYKVFAASSVDALVHATESYLSPRATDISRMFSIGAIERIVKGYIKIEAEGKDALSSLLHDFCTASLMAGIAFGNAGCGAVHAMSYPIGANFHVAHGESNYSVFVAVLRRYVEREPDGIISDLFGLYAELMGCKKDEVPSRLDDLLNTAAMNRKKLSEYGMTKETAGEFAASVIKNQQRLLANNYVPLSEKEIEDIYLSLL